ncbi:ComEA family DNA-binding protein [Pseudoalteromonas sp. SMS1]|uniref:ComEA family DNA-binding protein n=1 Tax=Pseudoalteromonas sp. SMS1 TaxID=2908894 RepID=UPI001F1693C1|nr:ComEA family DNA-binding protein [Pseudoalteromonas sp. SMS1]MCF2856300.1 ComEA family DNA-binding protein [Pseudoalteromonas sp. SMS1]
MRLEKIWSVGLILFVVAFFNIADAQSDAQLVESQVIININTASVEQLVTLPGIGLSKARAIVENREALGHFEDLASLTRVKGIGEGIVDKLKQHIVFE